MQYKLIHKQSKEVVDTIQVVKTEEQIAKEYFQNKKQLNPTSIRNYQNISRVYYEISDIKNCKERFGVF